LLASGRIAKGSIAEKKQNYQESIGVPMRVRNISLALLLLAIGGTSAFARKQPKFQQAHQLTPEQAALVQRAVARERVLIQNIEQRTPLVETYIQDTAPDVKLGTVPVDDVYMLSRVDFSKGFFDKSFTPRSEQQKSKGFFRNSLGSIAGIGKALGLDSKFTYNSLGFTEMMFLDPTSFDESHYVFNYVRREFLGSVRTWVFDVHPIVSGPGRFFGRVWIEDQDGNIVRFNGTFTPPGNEDSSKYYFHFDSWRQELQPGLWLPVGVYVEESQRGEGNKNLGLKAQTHFWGYSLKLPTRESENVNITVQDAEDKSQQGQDVSPLQAQRQWVSQAENNVIDRLVQAGLVAPSTPGGFEEKVLDQVVTNLSVPNNLNFSTPVHCRILLTSTIEATTVGNTILLSKGLVDTLPLDEGTLASVIAPELAHIALGHVIDTRYAFNDRLLFPDETTFQKINMYHTQADNEAAAKTAMTYLEASMYKNDLPKAGLYWEQLAQRGQALKALNTPRLGDSLLRPDGTPWMSQLASQAQKLNWDDLSQNPAQPLGSWLKVDPWSDRVAQLNAKFYPPMNARDKMPMEVTPIYYNLQRYSAPTDATAPAGQPADQNAAPATGTAAPADQQQQPQQPPATDNATPPPAQQQQPQPQQ
jgi:hypothetical protein